MYIILNADIETCIWC